MARIVKIEGFNEINLTNSVGKKGVNSSADVMVVQAMLKYAVEKNPYFAYTNFFPVPNGNMEEETLLNIKTFQMFVREKLNNRVSVDGRIDPAKGVFVSACKPGGRQRLTWTIGQLNGYCLEVALLNGKENYIADICKTFPQVKRALASSGARNLSIAMV